MKTTEWKLSQFIGQSRFLVFLVLYVSIQIVTLCIGLLIHLAIPSSIWCEVDLTHTSMQIFNARAACAGKQLWFITYLTVAGSALVGLYGFLFPQRIIRRFRQAEADNSANQ